MRDKAGCFTMEQKIEAVWCEGAYLFPHLLPVVIYYIILFTVLSLNLVNNFIRLLSEHFSVFLA
jgi:hypothetical protein